MNKNQNFKSIEEFIDHMLKDGTKEEVLDFICRQHKEILEILLRK